MYCTVDKAFSDFGSYSREIRLLQYCLFIRLKKSCQINYKYKCV